MCPSAKESPALALSVRKTFLVQLGGIRQIAYCQLVREVADGLLRHQSTRKIPYQREPTGPGPSSWSSRRQAPSGRRPSARTGPTSKRCAYEDRSTRRRSPAFTFDALAGRLGVSQCNSRSATPSSEAKPARRGEDEHNCHRGTEQEGRRGRPQHEPSRQRLTDRIDHEDQGVRKGEESRICPRHRL